MNKKILILLIFLLNFDSSSANEKNLLNNYDPINLDGSINVLIEIPAGSNEKKYFSEKENKIVKEFKLNKVRKIDYLPYPFNYGILPKTFESYSTGGDGDPLDVILIGHKINEGSIVKAKVVGIIYMKDNGEIDNKILATTYDDTFFKINSIKRLNENFPGIIEIIKIWLENYKGGFIEIIDIKNKKDSFNYINKSMIQFNKLKK